MNDNYINALLSSQISEKKEKKEQELKKKKEELDRGKSVGKVSCHSTFVRLSVSKILLHTLASSNLA